VGNRIEDNCLRLRNSAGSELDSDFGISQEGSNWFVVDAMLASRQVDGKSDHERRILDLAEYPLPGGRGEIATRLRTHAAQMFRQANATGADINPN